jgi:hypothetical protein
MRATQTTRESTWSQTAAHSFRKIAYAIFILQRGFLSLNWKECSKHDLRTEYFILCTHYIVIRTMLIGIAGHRRKRLARSRWSKLVQGFSKVAEHNAAFMDEVAKFVSDSGLNRPGEIVTLLA